MIILRTLKKQQQKKKLRYPEYQYEHAIALHLHIVSWNNVAVTFHTLSIYACLICTLLPPFAPGQREEGFQEHWRSRVIKAQTIVAYWLLVMDDFAPKSITDSTAHMCVLSYTLLVL